MVVRSAFEEFSKPQLDNVGDPKVEKACPWTKPSPTTDSTMRVPATVEVQRLETRNAAKTAFRFANIHTGMSGHTMDERVRAARVSEAVEIAMSQTEWVREPRIIAQTVAVSRKAVGVV